MLRQYQQTPEFSVIMPEKQDMGILDSDIQGLVVKDPNPLNFYGVFVPC